MLAAEQRLSGGAVEGPATRCGPELATRQSPAVHRGGLGRSGGPGTGAVGAADSAVVRVGKGHAVSAAWVLDPRTNGERFMRALAAAGNGSSIDATHGEVMLASLLLPILKS